MREPGRKRTAERTALYERMAEMQIRITENPAEMIRMAQDIIAEKKKYYTDEVLEDLRASVRKHTENLTPAEVEEHLYRSVYYYWAYGCTTDEYYYLKLSEKSPEEIKTYILTREKVLYIDQLNREEDAHILQNKYETYQLFQKYFRRDVVFCEGPESYDAFAGFVRKHPVFVLKPLTLGKGIGVHKEELRDFSETAVREKYESLIRENSATNEALVTRKGTSGFLVEELIDQADELNAIHPGSVNGIRVATLRIGGEIVVYKAWLRMGLGETFTDNGCTGGLMAGIDVRTGAVDTGGYSEKPAVYITHPDSGLTIKGFQIPRWGELLPLVKELAAQLPTINYVGWDMVLSKKGWVLMEGNFRGGFMWQLVEQRGMKADFEELTGLTLNKTFWWEK